MALKAVQDGKRVRLYDPDNAWSKHDLTTVEADRLARELADAASKARGGFQPRKFGHH